MALVGADVDQLSNLAKDFDRSAEMLTSTVKALSNMAADAARWRGADAERFRSEWAGFSMPAVTRAAGALREAAEVIRRNAREQEQASAGHGGAGQAGVTHGGNGSSEVAPRGLSGLWNQVSHVSDEKGSAGYQLQKVVGQDGVERYIVYIGGTDSAEGQTLWSNYPAASGIPDAKQLAALRRLIPDGAEVMLVGYSQGGMDAQNIAAQKDNGFKVTQIVTFGSPVRSDLSTPAVHLQANGDGIPYSAAGANPFGPYLTNSTGSNPDAHIYHGASDVKGMSKDIHERAYGGLADKWDKAEFPTAKGVSRFQGTVTSVSDIDVHGNVM